MKKELWKTYTGIRATVFRKTKLRTGRYLNNRREFKCDEKTGLKCKKLTDDDKTQLFDHC